MTMLRTQDKSPDAFRTISEVATELDVPQHVLRFWESKFASVKPLKRGGGRRYYRPDDLDLLRGIRTLLYRDEMSIRAVQKLLREQGVRYVAELGRGNARLSGSVDVVSVRAMAVAEQISAAHRFAEDVSAEEAADETLLTDEQRARLTERLDELLSLKARLAGVRRLSTAPH